MKKGLIAFTPAQVAAMRIFLASIILIPFALRNLKLITKKNILYLVFVGFIGTGIPPFLFTEAQTVINSATAGTLNSFTPVVALIIGFLFFKMKINFIKFLGVTMGFSGACLLILVKEGEQFDIDLHGLYVVAATICYSSSTFILKHFLQDMKPFNVAVLSFLFIGPPAGIYLLFADLQPVFSSHPFALRSFGYILILAILGSAIATILFNTLVKKSDPIFAQSVTYLMPVVALFWGLFDDEKLSFINYMGIVLILGGVYSINIKIKSGIG